MTIATMPCSAMARMGTRVFGWTFATALEEDAVLGHGVVDARRGEHALAEEAEGGDGDAGGDELGAGLAEGERMTVEAGVVVAARPSGPRARRQMALTAR